MDLLRLAGAAGVGKSTTAWAIAQRLVAEGVASGFVDIDQLGMCYPPPAGDPDRWALKERALTAVAGEFARAGVARLVVSGVAWPDDPPPTIPGISVHSVWLDASEETRRERLDVRRNEPEQVERSLAAGTAEAARVHPAWERVDTERRSAAATAEDVLARWRVTAMPGESAEPAGPDAGLGGGRVLWITGPRLAGASRIGWEVATHDWEAGRRVGFADVRQLSFAWNVDRPVGLANLARVHATFQQAGARRFVAVAPWEIEPEAVRAALPTSEVVFLRLSAPDAERRARALSRRDEGGPLLAGDDILHASDAVIARIIHTSGARWKVPPRDEEQIIEVGDLSLADAVAAVRRSSGW
ncbi:MULTISPECIES: hypothetical protein [Microbacterium]|uniref:hypothetical protein n=1 Tax=Microbacterium TaxID=33882 RepID=UPI001430DD73|nr:MULTISPECIES: hypothetical protein [Microbacterium]MCK6066439.1 AAA family ATPase [Microbacterium sp. EYE_512]